MSTPIKLIVGLVIAAIAATIVSVLATGAAFDPVLLLAFALSTTAGVLIGAQGGSATQKEHDKKTERKRRSEKQDTEAGREFGEVKWFNVSKGFGFIIRDNGEEIFVHFRSIRGKGRRGLRDGQRVSFLVVENEKGPQAEDVATER